MPATSCSGVGLAEGPMVAVGLAESEGVAVAELLAVAVELGVAGALLRVEGVTDG